MLNPSDSFEPNSDNQEPVDPNKKFIFPNDLPVPMTIDQRLKAIELLLKAKEQQAESWIIDDLNAFLEYPSQREALDRRLGYLDSSADTEG